MTYDIYGRYDVHSRTRFIVRRYNKDNVIKFFTFKIKGKTFVPIIKKIGKYLILCKGLCYQLKLERDDNNMRVIVYAV